jgi:hypothetical protein
MQQVIRSVHSTHLLMRLLQRLLRSRQLQLRLVRRCLLHLHGTQQHHLQRCRRTH